MWENGAYGDGLEAAGVEASKASLSSAHPIPHPKRTSEWVGPLSSGYGL